MEQILTTILKYLIGIIGVGFIVLLHEIGHFIAAHIFKIDVEIFSVGFGPKMVGKKLGHTEYRISWFLFGGYCRMKGSDDLTRALDSNNKKFVHVENGSLFAVKPVNKFFTYLAGPLTNFIITIVLCTFLLATNHQTLSSPAIVTPIDQYPTLSKNQISPASLFGVKPHDKILKINNQEIEDWQQVVEILNSNKEKALSFLIERESKQYNIIIEGVENNDGTFRYGLTPLISTQISSVRFLSPEYNAGLRKNDIILEVNNISVNNNLDLIKAFNESNINQINLKINQNGELKNIYYTPQINYDKTTKHNFALYSPTKTIKGVAINEAFPQGYTMAKNLFFNTISSLLSIIKGENNNIREVFTGPMRASLMIGNITILGLENNLISGIRAFLYLLAVVSISITIANLLPLPAFDGGQMLISLIEIITQKRISPKNYWICQLFGMICVILLFSFMYFIDFKYFFKLFMNK